MGRYVYISENLELLDRYSRTEYVGEEGGRFLGVGENLNDAYAQAELIIAELPNLYSDGIKISEEAIRMDKVIQDEAAALAEEYEMSGIFGI